MHLLCSTQTTLWRVGLGALPLSCPSLIPAAKREKKYGTHCVGSDAHHLHSHLLKTWSHGHVQPQRRSGKAIWLKSPESLYNPTNTEGENECPDVPRRSPPSRMNYKAPGRCASDLGELKRKTKEITQETLQRQRNGKIKDVLWVLRRSNRIGKREYLKQWRPRIF